MRNDEGVLEKKRKINELTTEERYSISSLIRTIPLRKVAVNTIIEEKW